MPGSSSSRSRAPRQPPHRRRPALEPLEVRRLLAAVTVDTDQVFQTITGIGGNYAQGRKVGSPYINDTVGQYTLDNLSVAVGRVGIPLKAWEPVNDDESADTVNGAGFVNSPDIQNVFLMMQELHNRGIPITASIWDAPNWMVSNPTASEDRVVPAVNYAELSESIEQFLVTARDVYGVPVEAVSFNEADAGFFLIFTAQEHANFIKVAGPRMEALGLPAKWLVGDTAQVAPLFNYAKTILEDADARPYLGAVSYHSWTALTATDTQFTRIYDLANQYGKAVWCTEVGYDATLHFTPNVFKTWDYGAKLARTYHRVLKLSRASVLHYWEYQNDYPLVNSSNLTPNPAYYVVKELAEGLKPGAQIVAADSDESTVMAIAGKHVEDETFMLQLVNTSTSAEQVSINGLPSSAFTLIRSSATQNGINLGTYNPVNGILTLTLPADSVSTLRGRLAAPSPWQGRDVGAVGIAGRETYDGGMYRLFASGNGFSDSNDGFHFVHQPAAGNASLIARVVARGDLTSSTPPSGAEAGVMIRDGVGSDARFAALVLSDNRAYFRYRDATGAAAVEGGHENGVIGEYWVRLTREGDVFTASISPDASTWTVVGSATITMPMATQVGLASTSGDDAVLTSASFDQVRATALPVALAPSRLAAVQMSHTRIDLSWLDNAGNEDFFEIERSSDGGATFAPLATVPTNIPRYSDTTAAPGTEYVYRVRAANEVGQSAFSFTARALTPTYHEAEDAPRSASGVRFGFTPTITGHTGTGWVDYQSAGGWVEWTINVPFTGGYALDFRYGNGSINVQSIAMDVDGVFASNVTFPGTGSYSNWAFRTLNVQLTAGTHTIRATATPTFPDLINMDALRVRPIIAPAPASFVAKPINGRIELTWLDSALSTDTYRIERSLDGITFTEVATTAANATGWTDPSTELLVPYFYQVRATNPAGDSRYTPIGVATIPTIPADPLNLAATAVAPVRIDLAWEDLSDNEDGFRIERSTDGVNYALFTTTAPNATSISVLASPETHYWFRVRATNGGGDSAHIDADVTTPPTTIFAPSPGAGYSWGGSGAAPLLTVYSGNVTFTGDAQIDFPNLSIIVQTGANVTFDATQHLASLIVGSSSTAVMPASGDRYLYTKALAINATGRFDMADNDLIWDYSGTTTYTTAKNFVINGRNNPGGNGGIVSTNLGNTVMAIVDNTVLGRSSWMGQTIDTSTVIGTFTYFGDANVDGKVTSDDYVAIDVNLGIGNGTRQWIHGDFNFDANVTSDDYVAIDVNLGAGSTPSPETAELQAEMITIHATQFGGKTYRKAVEAAAKDVYKIGPKKPAR